MKATLCFLIGIFAGVGLTALVAGPKVEVVEKIGGHAITTADFIDDYEARVDRLMRLAHLDRKALAVGLCRASMEWEREVAAELDPDQAYRRYREKRMVEQIALAEGFKSRPIVQRIIEQAELELLTQLYLTERVARATQITQAQAKSKCAQLRKEDTGRFGSLDEHDCIALAKQVLTRDQFARIMPEVVAEIRKRSSIVANPKFDRDAFLRSGVSPYLALRKEGGCAGGGRPE